ncbi:MAG: acyl-CoA thioesterase II [Rhodomicrobium sp.]|nr:MAG: acyl-CoA thioesterase II [Rhodomicrobium sp.]
MSKAFEILLDTLNLTPKSELIYEGPSYDPGWNRVYGGQVIAQALIAASKTAPDKECHSLHGYFMRPGDPDQAVSYHVDPVHDGRSFLTRMIHAKQGNETIFAMSASFHRKETGLDHQDSLVDIPKPEDLPNAAELLDQHSDKLPPEVVAYFLRDRSFEMRPIDINRYINPTPSKPEQGFWIRPSGKIDGSKAIQKAALAFVSDFTLLDTALIAHGKLLFDPAIMTVSLDHSIWFHRPFDINDWLFYRLTSPNAYGARALCFGQFYDQNGKLIASTAQEGLTRPVQRK